MRVLTTNQTNIIHLLKREGAATYTDIEPLITTDHHSLTWATLSCISGLVQSGIVVTDYKGQSVTYKLSKYGRELL